MSRADKTRSVHAFTIQGPDDYEIVDVPLPEPDEGELLVHPLLVGLCATDRELLDGSMTYYHTGHASYPLVPGHEWVGRVIAVGLAVSCFDVGDVVVGECSIGCGVCQLCCQGNYHLCPARSETGLFGQSGALREVMRYPARSAHHVPDSVELLDAVLAEPTAVALRTVKRLGRISSSDKVLVIGGGNLGCLIIGVLTALYGCEVIVAERDLARASRAQSWGARPLDYGELFTEAIDASGTPSGFALALDHLAPAARLVIAGLSGAVQQDFTLDRLVVNDLRLTGSLGSPGVWTEALQLIEQGLHPSKLVTHTLPMESIDEAINLLRSPDAAGKVIVRIDRNQ